MKVSHLNGGLVSTFTHPWSDGTTGMRLSPMELLEKLAALVPLPHMHLMRYGGCLAPHSLLRGAITPTPRQQGLDEETTELQTQGYRVSERSINRLLHHLCYSLQSNRKTVEGN